MTIDPILPPSWIVAIALVASLLTGWAHWVAGRRVGTARNALLTVLRLLAILAVVALLLQPSREDLIRPPSVERALLFALDSSASMDEADADGTRRIDRARKSLEDAGAFQDGTPCRFYLFDEDARLATPEGMRVAPALGTDTRFHSSLRTILRSHAGAPPAGLIVLTDGHDFEAIPPGQTARLAQSRQCPIYAVPFGAGGNARDVSVRVMNYHPYTFQKQQTRLSALIRTIGCPHESLTVSLRREGQTVQTKHLETGDQSFHHLDFVVSEENAGQFEYAFRVHPLPHKLEAENNTAVNYLNVLDEKIRILIIEGDPYWDTTFLRRSLARNDKLEVDSLVRFTESRARAIRSNPKRRDEPLDTPNTVEKLSAYKIVILGRRVETILGTVGLAALEEFVDRHGGIVVFSRGRAWDEEGPDALEPVKWSDQTREAEVEITSGGMSLPPFKLLNERLGRDPLPKVVSYEPDGDLKTLAAPYGQTALSEVAIVYRRLGRGQTLSLGLANLWKWVFNPKSEFDNNLYDLFWDQLVLWLLANGGISPSSDYAFQTNTANLPLGESLRFSLLLNKQAPPPQPPDVTLFRGQEIAARLALGADPDDQSYSAEFSPRATGRYRAELTLPNGRKSSVRFMVFREELERTETASDVAYLKQLSQASGGRLLQPRDIPDLVANLLRESAPMEARTRLTPIWDTATICLFIAFLFALEWYLRRRWGLN